jgi:hypothetical protein
VQQPAEACGVCKPDRAWAEGMVGLPRLRIVAGLCPLDLGDLEQGLGTLHALTNWGRLPTTAMTRISL